MSIPARMTAIAIREPGAPDVLVPQERDVPQPKAGEVLVKIAAAGVNISTAEVKTHGSDGRALAVFEVSVSSAPPRGISFSARWASAVNE